MTRGPCHPISRPQQTGALRAKACIYRGFRILGCLRWGQVWMTAPYFLDSADSNKTLQQLRMSDAKDCHEIVANPWSVWYHHMRTVRFQNTSSLGMLSWYHRSYRFNHRVVSTNESDRRVGRWRPLLWFYRWYCCCDEVWNKYPVHGIYRVCTSITYTPVFEQLINVVRMCKRLMRAVVF